MARNKSIDLKLIAVLLFTIFAFLVFWIHGASNSEFAPKNSTAVRNATPTAITVSDKPVLVPYEKVNDCLALNFSEKMVCLNGLGLSPVEDCEKADLPGEREDCYNFFSMKMGCQDLCGLMVTFRSRAGCFTGCAVNLMKPWLCDYATDEYNRLICLGFSASESNNRMVCDSIPSSGLIKDTYLYDRNYSLFKDLCYVAVAATKNVSVNDTSLCELVSDSDLMLYCKAMVLDDTSLCGRINDTYRREKCVDDNVQVQFQRSSKSPYFPQTRIGRPYYFIYIAQIVDNKSRIW